MKTNKLKTLDEFCNLSPGSFQKFLEEKNTYLKDLEEKRKARIRAARKK